MSATGQHENPVRVFVCSPSGQDGQGGIDRLMDSIFDRAEEVGSRGVVMTRLVTRGPRAATTALFLPLALMHIAQARVFRRIDVLHINLASRGSALRKIVLAKFAELLGIAYVIHLHGADFADFYRNSPKALQAGIRRLFANAQRIVVLGSVWAAFVREIVPAAQTRIVVLPNATLTRPRRDHPGTKLQDCRIVFTGELGPRKGVPQLVSALRNLRDVPGWSAVIAGNGQIEETREAVVAEGLQTRVDIPGWLRGDDLTRTLNQASIFVLPSFAENLPMSVIEGMAHGLAIVTTPVGAVEDIIQDGRTGLLVPPGDVGALAGALERLVRDPDLRMQLGRSAQEFQRKHLAIDAYVLELAQHWRDVAVMGKRRRGMPHTDLPVTRS